MFGRKSRAKRAKEKAQKTSVVPALATFFAGARPLAERLINDDELRDNIRTFTKNAQRIYDELSDENPADAVARLWDDDKLRSQIEDAIQAFLEGSRRMRGERVAGGGGGGGASVVLLLLLAAGIAALFLHPRTGPEARRLAGEAVQALRSGT